MPATNTDPAERAAATPAQADPDAADVRSGSLLPAGDDQGDGRFAVAEEVSLDQQSEAARQVGRLPPDPVPGAGLTEAVAGTLAPPESTPPPDPDNASP